MRRFWYYGASSAGASSLLLDLYPNLFGWSLMKISSSFVGDIITVRRTGDNAELSFNFTEIIDGTLLSWVLSGGGTQSGRVTIWKGQGIGVPDMIQPTATSQPFIVETGVLNILNSKPFISRGPVNSFMYAATTFPTGDILTTNIFVGKRLSGSGYNSINGVAPSTSYTADRRHINSSIESVTSFTVRLEGGNTVFNSSGLSNEVLISSWRDAPNTAFKARKNGVLLTVASSAAGKDLNIESDSAFTIFQTGGLNYTLSSPPGDYIIKESIWALSDESADLSAIETNINTRYGIY